MLDRVFINSCAGLCVYFLCTVTLLNPLHARNWISSAHAQTSIDTDFFKGKTITVITSTGVGGGYDVMARLIAHHMPHHIPGNPTMIVQNMPGGGNVLATNYMYDIAPKDGTSIATINNAIPLHQVLGGKGVRFDAAKFNWLGSPVLDNEVVLAWHTAGIMTIQDVMKKEVVLGGTGAGSAIVIIPTAMNNVLDTKFKIVIGYKSSEDINLAMQRGEVQARTFGLSGIMSQHQNWLTEHQISVLAQIGTKRDHILPDVPLITELAKTDEQRAILKLISAPPALGHPYLAPPRVPRDRVALLRAAFAATLRDDAFLVEATKDKFDIEPMNGEEVARIIQETINTPAEIVAKAKAAMGPGALSGGD